jgi:hypothetical protein
MTSLLANLPKLQDDSKRRLPSYVVDYLFRNGFKLIRTESQGHTKLHVPSRGTMSLLQNLKSREKVLTVDASNEEYVGKLNKELKGGSAYPILEAVLAASVGLAETVAAAVFSVATLALSLNRRSNDVLARGGDEIWLVEEIGMGREENVLTADRRVPMHVAALFLTDPFRGQADVKTKGWLLHEERRNLTLR